jgi:sigma-B regulation protein RsbU (phosphoserine phosphatase)
LDWVTILEAELTEKQQAGIEIVIAEDSRIQAKILDRRLTEAGHRVRWGENGQAALELVRQQRPAIIVSDIEMPTMTGYEFCKAVKGDPDLQTIPFILLSTLSDPLDIIRGLDAGADNYVTKPYEPDYLLGRIRSLLETPLAAEEAAESTIDVAIAGQTFKVKAGRQQVLNLLVSTFENAVAKNQELIQTNQDLATAKERLERNNQELKELNEKIATANDQMTRDLEAAARVQRSLLPAEEQLTFDCGDVAWRYVPCHGLAGDFLNVFKLDEEHLGLFVVDVSGHGVPSSLLSVTVGRFLTPKASDSSVLVRPGEDGTIVVVPPVEVATELNRQFQSEDFSELYFTFVYCVVNTKTGQVRYTASGHPPLLRLPAAGDAAFQTLHSLPIGFFPEAEYEEQTLQLEPGDRLYLYSDGVTEAMDKDLQQFGDDALVEVVTLNRSRPLDAGVSELLETIQAWCQPKGPLDDVSILGFEWRG